MSYRETVHGSGPEKANLDLIFDNEFQERNLRRLQLSGVTDVTEVALASYSSLIGSSNELVELVDASLLDGVAQQFVESSQASTGDRVLIRGTKYTYPLVKAIAMLLMQRGVEFVVDIGDEALENGLVSKSTDEGLEALAAEKLQLYDGVKTQLMVGNLPDQSLPKDKDRMDKYADMIKAIRERCQSGENHYVLALVPTEADAVQDQSEYQEYLRIFFEACDQPWAEIEAAQAKLIERLDAAKDVVITNDDGTNLTMSVEGMTFANSAVLKNIPGSEVFSAPVRESVNGVLVAKGRFQYDTSAVMEDITLEFKDGRIISHSAKVGDDDLTRIIEKDDGQGEGSRFTGELGIGTNPHLRHHYVNPLLVEKVGGSFHFALGNAYAFNTYNGQPVVVNNGNKSASATHWDVTAILRGNGGKIIVDGEIIQADGQWLDPELAVLNEGWGAVDLARQPTWWRERYPSVY